MKQGGQLNKSRNHEREVAGLFTQAVYPDGDGEFRRVPLSGGWDKRIAPGDVIPFKKTDEGMIMDIKFPFLPIECKNWRKENVNFLFSGLYTNESIIYDWMQQAIDDGAEWAAEKHDASLRRIPLVVFKFWKENVAMFYHGDYGELAGLFGHMGKKFYRIQIWEDEYKHWDLHFYLLTDFLKWIDWEHFK